MASQIESVSGTLNEPLNPGDNSLRAFKKSEQDLQSAVDKIRLKKPELLHLGPDLTLALSTADVKIFSDPETFVQVAEGVLATAEQRREGLLSRIGNILARIAPLAGIGLGVTRFAADAAGVGPLGLVATGLGAVLAYALQENDRGDAVVKQLNDLSYNRRFVVRIVDANQSADQDIVDACLQLLTELNNFLRTSLLYLARTHTHNLVRGLVNNKVDGSALNGALTRLDKVLERKVNLIILEDKESQQRQELLKWFSQLDFKTVQAKYQRDACEGCGTWFLQCDEVKRLISGEMRWLWCEGSAGVGKTNLMSLLVKTLEREVQDKLAISEASNRLLTFVFCDVNDQQRQDAEALFGSIACQIVQNRLNYLYRPAQLFRERYPPGSIPTLKDLVAFIDESIPEGFHLLIFVDAIDELQDCEEFLDALEDLLERLSRRLSILTTMRPEEYLRRGQVGNRYDSFLQIGTSTADLKVYVEARIRESKPVRFDMDDQVRQQIISTIVRKADDRFILGRLQLDSLYQLRPSSPGDLDYDLSNLPLRIEEFYDKAMRMIDGNRDALRLLSWVLVVPKPLSFTDLEAWERIHPTQRRGPLSIQELSHALLLRPERPPVRDWDTINRHSCPIEDIVGWSRGLCTLDEDGNTVTFTHPTAQEYLIARKSTLFPKFEAYRCRACIAYLSIDKFQAGPCMNMTEWDARVKSFPFLEYAARNWCEIKGLTSTWEDINKEIEDDIVAFLSHEGLVANLAQVIAYSNGWMTGNDIYIPHTTGLIVAMQFNLLGVMKRLCDAGADVNLRAETGQTALDLAVTADPPYTRLLLDYGARVTDESGRSALRIAVERLPRRRLWGGVEIIKMLLEADPTLTDQVRNQVNDGVHRIEGMKHMTMMAYHATDMVLDESMRFRQLLDGGELGHISDSQRRSVEDCPDTYWHLGGIQY